MIKRLFLDWRNRIRSDLAVDQRVKLTIPIQPGQAVSPLLICDNASFLTDVTSDLLVLERVVEPGFFQIVILPQFSPLTYTMPSPF